MTCPAAATEPLSGVTPGRVSRVAAVLLGLCLLSLLPGRLALVPAAGAQTPTPQSIGAYFSLVNTYVYEKGPREGRRELVRPRQAFAVLDAMVDGQEVIWYLVLFPQSTTKVAGAGWTPSAPHEILSAQLEPVLVFTRIPTDGLRGTSVTRVPAGSVELLNEAQTGPAFARVDWQKVRFSMDAPARMWVRSVTGIFRPGKSATFMSRVYGEMVTRNVDKDEASRLLAGVVHIGDAVRNVRWAMGDPLRSQDETVGTARRTVWQYPEMSITFENDVVKQIN